VTGEVAACGLAGHNGPGTYPMTYEQESLWLDDHLRGEQSRYLESWACRLAGPLDVAAVEWAISQVVARHQVLRSRLTMLDEGLAQVVNPVSPVPLEILPCASAGLPAQLSWITDQALDLNESPLRPWLLRVAPGEFVLVVQFHHAVVDDWALAVFQAEFAEFYTARVLGRAVNLESLPMQSGDYAVAQRADGIDPRHVAYWRERLRNRPEASTIPPDRPRSRQQEHRGARQPFLVTPAVGQAVRATSRAQRSTPYVVFLASLAAVLWSHGERTEVIVGTPISRRGAAGVDRMIGCLTDLLPLRLSVSAGASLGTLISTSKAEVIAAMEHRAIPYAELVRMTRGRVGGPGPLCRIALVVDDMRQPPLSLPGIEAQRIYIPPGRAKFDVCLTLIADDEGGGYTGFCDYDADIYQAATMARITAQFTEALAHGTAAPTESLTGAPWRNRGISGG
jgi:hypothetical protein